MSDCNETDVGPVPINDHASSAMRDVLIPLSLLHEKNEIIREVVQTLRTTDIVDTPDSETDQALVYYFLFSEEGAVQKVGLMPISREEMFYNSYYWFLIFAKRYQAKRGYDGGIEQQAFKLLEEAPSSVDWDRVQEVDALARQGA